MLAAILFTSFLIADIQAQSIFFSPLDLHDATGVTLRAVVPEDATVLENSDPANPKLWCMPVAANPEGTGVNIWYQRVNSAEKEFSDQRTLCLGVLTDTAWSLPALTPESPVWGGPNNVVMRRSPYKPTWGGFNVFQICREGDGFRMLYWDQPSADGQAGAMLASSSDGRVWNKDLPHSVFTEPNDAFTLVPTGSGYVLYQTRLEDWPDKPYPDNLDKKRRVIALRHSKDLKEWTPQELCLKPDTQDSPETEFYLMKVFSDANGFWGLIMKYYADPALPNKHSAILKNELAFSEDGRTWMRPFRDTDLGFWSYADPFVHKGRLSFVAWKDKKMMTVTCPHNSLTEVVAESDGTFVMRPRHLPERMVLHCDVSKGWIEASLLDEQGDPVKGMPPVRIEAKPDSVFPLPWHMEATRKYRIAFKLFNARLFALGECKG